MRSVLCTQSREVFDSGEHNSLPSASYLVHWLVECSIRKLFKGLTYAFELIAIPSPATSGFASFSTGHLYLVRIGFLELDFRYLVVGFFRRRFRWVSAVEERNFCLVAKLKVCLTTNLS